MGKKLEVGLCSSHRQSTSLVSRAETRLRNSKESKKGLMIITLNWKEKNNDQSRVKQGQQGLRRLRCISPLSHLKTREFTKSNSVQLNRNYPFQDKNTSTHHSTHPVNKTSKNQNNQNVVSTKIAKVRMDR